jgi:hypothetical protein
MFHAAGLPLCRPVLTEEQGLGPFVSDCVGRPGGAAPSAPLDGLPFAMEDK